MTLVLLVLAVIWAVVLIPPAVRARAEGRPGDSISAFHRQLSVLRRTGPSGRRNMAQGSRQTVAPIGRPPLGLVGKPNSALVPTAVRPAPLTAPRASGISGPSVSSTRSRTLQRRRAVLGGLVATAAGTLVLGMVPFLRPLLMMNLVVDVLLVAYVTLLIRQRDAVAEKEMTVSFLPHAVPLDPMLRVEPAYLQRSASY